MAAKMFELLKEVAPEVRRVAMLFNPDTAPGGGRYYYGDFESAAKVVGIEPIQARARNDAEIENAIASLQGSVGGGLIVMPDFFYAE